MVRVKVLPNRSKMKGKVKKRYQRYISTSAGKKRTLKNRKRFQEVPGYFSMSTALTGLRNRLRQEKLSKRKRLELELEILKLLRKRTVLLLKHTKQKSKEAA